MKVIALDPGVTTGYAVGLIAAGQPMGVISGQFKWNELGLYNELVSGRPDIVIYEAFESGKDNPYRKKTNYGYDVELFSRNLIGVIRLYCMQHPEISMYEQTPSKGLGGTFKSLSTLQKHGVHKVANPHADDAMRHLLQWYTTGSGFQYQPNKEGFRPLA